MKTWIIGGLAGACLGVGAYFTLTNKSAPVAVEPSPAPAVAVAPAPPAAPVVLANVIEVADLDPLLDPPAKPVVGVPFDEDGVAVPVSAPAAPERIPPAVDEPEVKPLPPGAVIYPLFGPGGQLLGIGCFF